MTAKSEEVTSARNGEPREEDDRMELAGAAASPAASAGSGKGFEGGDYMSDRQMAMRKRQDLMKKQREEQERLRQEQIREHMEKQQEKKRKKKESERKSPVAVSGAPAGPDAPPRNVKTKADHQKAAKLLKGEIERVKRERDRVKREKAKIEVQGAVKTAETGSAYPTDDLFIPDLAHPLQSKNWVKVGRLPQELVGDFLMVADFLRMFGRVLLLSPITNDQLLDALTFTGGETSLLAQVHMALLRIILSDWFFPELLATHKPVEDQEAKDDDDDNKMDVVGADDTPAVGTAGAPPSTNGEENGSSNVPYEGLLYTGFQPQLVRASTWPGVMRELIPRLGVYRDAMDECGKPLDVISSSSSFSDLLRQAITNLDTTEYASLCLHDKITLLRILVDAAYETVEITNHIDKHMDHRREVLEKKRNEELDEKRRQREEHAGKKQEVIKRLKQRMEDEWRAQQEQAGGDGAGGEEGAQPKMPKFNPTATQINAELEVLLSAEVPGCDLEVKELPEWDPMSDDDDEGEDEDAEALERMTRLERNKKKKEQERKVSRRRHKEKERERRLQKDMERAEAISLLDDAVKVRRDPGSIKRALQAGRQAGLEGEKWCTVEMKEAYKALLDLEHEARRAQQQTKLMRELEQYSVRTEPLGYDRDLKCYYRFDGDPRLWVEEIRHLETHALLGSFVCEEITTARKEDERIKKERAEETQQDMVVFKKLKQGFADQGMEEEEATAAAWKAFSDQLPEAEEDPTLNAALSRLSRLSPQNFYSSWSTIDAFEDNIKSLLHRLDLRGARESALRLRIIEKFPELTLTAEEEEWDRTGSEYLWKRVRRVYDEKDGAREPAMGYIVGWLSAEKNEGMALWHMEHDDADEEDLEEFEVIEAIRLAKEYEAAKTKGGVAQKEKASSTTNSQSFRKYTNVLFDKNESCGEECLGLDGLKRDMLSAATCVVSPLKERGSDWIQARQDGKSAWERSVAVSDGVAELSDLLVTLEDVAHQTQEDEDYDEDAEAAKESEASNHKTVSAAAKENGDDGGVEEEKSATTHKDVSGASTTAAEEEKEDDEETVSESEETETEDEEDSKRLANKKAAVQEKASAASSRKRERPRRTLWPSLQERNRWIAKVWSQRSSGGLSLGLICLVKRLKDYGLWDANQEGVGISAPPSVISNPSTRTRKRIRG